MCLITTDNNGKTGEKSIFCVYFITIIIEYVETIKREREGGRVGRDWLEEGEGGGRVGGGGEGKG